VPGCVKPLAPEAPRPDLYSARHQFAANCKAGGLEPAEIAVLMALGSENTARNNFAI